MIYNYPKEFVVTVIYDNNLKFGPNDGQKKLGLLDDELLGEEVLKNSSVSDEKNTKESFEDYATDEIEDNIFSNSSKYENNKDILNEIDDEYANSQTEAV